MMTKDQTIESLHFKIRELENDIEAFAECLNLMNEECFDLERKVEKAEKVVSASKNCLLIDYTLLPTGECDEHPTWEALGESLKEYYDLLDELSHSASSRRMQRSRRGILHE